MTVDQVPLIFLFCKGVGVSGETWPNYPSAFAGG